MGLRFSKRIKIAPGVSLNLGKNGFSVSVGPKGAKVTVGSNGKVTGSVGIPGTGIYYRETLLNNKKGNIVNSSINGDLKNMATSTTPTNIRTARTVGIFFIFAAIVFLCLRIFTVSAIFAFFGILPFLVYRKFTCEECGMVDYPIIAADGAKLCSLCLGEGIKENSPKLSSEEFVEKYCIYCGKVPTVEATDCSECGAKMYNDRANIAVLINDTVELLTGEKGEFVLKEDDKIETLKMTVVNLRKQYIETHLKVDTNMVQSCIGVLGSTKDLITFFSRVNICMRYINKLKRAKELIPLIKMEIGGNSDDISVPVIDGIENEKPRIIKRSYNDVVYNSLNLKTVRGRNKRLLDYLLILKSYEKELGYLDEYKNVVREIESKTNKT